MRQIITNYSFNAASKQIDFSSYPGFDIQKLTAIINVTSNQLIYQSGNLIYGYSAFSSNVLTLLFDTTSMNNGDLLQIYYDSSEIPAIGQKTNSESLPVVLSTQQAQDKYSIGQGGRFALNANILNEVAGNTSVDTFTDGVTYRSFFCQVIGSAGITSEQILFEGSNDNVTFHPLAIQDDGAATGSVILTAIAIAANTNRFFSGRTGYRYIKCRISTIFAGGTVQAFTTYSTSEYRPRISPVTQTVGGNFSTTISSSLPSGATAIGDVGIQYRANATGAASKIHLVSAASTNPTIVKASAGRVIGWSLANTTASFVYVKLHNQSTSPTAGTSVFMVIPIAPNSIAQLSLAGGIAFSTGIGFTIVTGSADSDANAVTIGAVVGEIFFS